MNVVQLTSQVHRILITSFVLMATQGNLLANVKEQGIKSLSNEKNEFYFSYHLSFLCIGHQ